jgi:hypothetical protein
MRLGLLLLVLRDARQTLGPILVGWVQVVVSRRVETLSRTVMCTAHADDHRRARQTSKSIENVGPIPAELHRGRSPREFSARNTRIWVGDDFREGRCDHLDHRAEANLTSASSTTTTSRSCAAGPAPRHEDQGFGAKAHTRAGSHAPELAQPRPWQPILTVPKSAVRRADSVHAARGAQLPG